MSSDTQLADQFLYQSSLKSDPSVKVSSRKQTPYVIDINQGSYANGIITLDGTSQLNGAEGFGCLRDGYLMLPYKVSMANTGSTDFVAVANRLSVGFKTGIWNVIDSMSLELNGKSIISMADYKLFANNLRAQFECSRDYIEKHGAGSFLYPDSVGSLQFSATANANGDGYTNTATDLSYKYATGGTDGSGSEPTNEGFIKRLLANPQVAPASGSTNGWPTLASGAAKTIANQLGKGAFVPGAAGTHPTSPATATIVGTWHHMLKIKLVDLHPIFKELDLMANPQIKLRLRVNQGYCKIATGTAASGSTPMSLTSTTLISGQTCPIMIASAASGCPNAGVFNTTSGECTIAWGAVSNYLEPTVDGTIFPFTTSRLYIPFVNLENPQSIIQKPNKTIKYLDFYPQWFDKRAGSQTSSNQMNTPFDLQLSASLKNAKYVAVLPFAETSAGTFASATVQQFQSPFDSAPWTLQPGSSIRNFNVRVGADQAFTLSVDFDYQQFSDEVSKISAINGDQSHELSNGLLDARRWSSTNRMLIADVSRLSEKDVPQSFQIMGVNAACQGSNLLTLVAHENELTYNRLTGEVLDYTAN